MWQGPPAWSRWARYWLYLSLPCFAAAIALLFARIELGWVRGSWVGVVVLTLFFVPVFVISPIMQLPRRHIRRAWRDSGGRLCTHCAYDLSALEPEGLCPECGRAFDVESDAMLWKNAGLTRDPPQS